MWGAPLPARSPYLKPWTMKGSDSRNKRGMRGAQVSFFGYRAGVQTAEGDEPATLSLIEARRFLLFF